MGWRRAYSCPVLWGTNNERTCHTEMTSNRGEAGREAYLNGLE